MKQLIEWKDKPRKEIPPGKGVIINSEDIILMWEWYSDTYTADYTSIELDDEVIQVGGKRIEEINNRLKYGSIVIGKAPGGKSGWMWKIQNIREAKKNEST
jgi:hypothetical protein